MSSYTRKTGCPTWNFAVVVVQHPVTKLYLAVDESKCRGWWLPAGYVDPGDDFVSAAHRETKEEAGIDIVLKGILRIEHGINDQTARMRVIFFANPSDLNQAPKSEPDSESNGARWVSLAELQQWKTEKKLRGDELLEWGTYLENGGPVYPLSLFASEETAVAPPAVVASVVSSKGVLQPAEAGCIAQ